MGADRTGETREGAATAKREAAAGEALARVAPGAARARGTAGSFLAAAIPLLAGLAGAGLLLAALGSNPFTFYANMIDRGLLDPDGLQESVIRMAPLLLIAAGLIVAFRASLWNLGVDGQFLLGAALSAGLAPSLAGTIGVGPTLALMVAVAAAVGALWTLIPSLLKAAYGVNEIITTLMMTFIGLAFANILVKGPFLTEAGGVARTDVLEIDDRLPDLLGTRIHSGILIALAGILGVHVLMTRTSLGLKLRVLGANPRAATHLGLSPARLTVGAFAISGALVGMAGAVEILGVVGSFRADFNPAFGLLVIPLVFLARLDALASIAVVAAFSVIQIGGESAAREADVSSDFLLALVGLVLIFVALGDHLRKRRRSAGSGGALSGLTERIRAPSGEVATERTAIEKASYAGDS